MVKWKFCFNLTFALIYVIFSSRISDIIFGYQEFQKDQSNIKATTNIIGSKEKAKVDKSINIFSEKEIQHALFILQKFSKIWLSKLFKHFSAVYTEEALNTCFVHIIRKLEMNS